MNIVALIDCNNFYASCERIFNPALENKPVVVLSNNDGCIIARSNEAKKLLIPMGAPFHEWRTLCEKHHVHVFSSNYELYGDISQRVMTILQAHCPDMEIYSIDEAFVSFDQFRLHDIDHYAAVIRKTIRQWTGIPVSIGIAPTKTLAKIANAIAKKQATSGIFNLCDKKQLEKILDQFPVEDIWGIGRQIATKLKSMHIYTAGQLRNTHMKLLRKQFSVVMERTIEELNGISCLELESVQPRKQIMSSRSFGKKITALSELEEAVSHYTAIACVKLRNQHSLANGLLVFLQIRDKNGPRQQQLSYYFAQPTNDTRQIISAAKQCVKKLFIPGMRYHKAGMMLLNLMPASLQQYDFFAVHHPEKSFRVMQTIDHINETLGKNALFFCAEGIKKPWQIRCDRRSPRYTTRWDEILTI